MKIRNLFKIGALIIILVIYFLFPNNNLSVDSLSYGSSVKYGVDLFSAHHLLYNYFTFVLFSVIKVVFPTIDALKFMQFTNALFTVFSLLLLRKLIIKLSNDKDKADIWTFFVAACFGVMRFAVEAETYIMPIFFSIISSLFYFKYLKDKKLINILLCSIFVSVACLFHQIHLFWGIGLFFGLLFFGKTKHVLIFSVVTLLIPLVYSLVLVIHYQIDFSFENLIRFLGEYYFSDNADVKIGLINLIITPITFFRTFFQVHGVVIEVLRLLPVFYIIIPIVLFLIFWGLIKLIKSVSFSHFKLIEYPFEFTHLLIFMLQFAFAFYSHGNSEFMVMLPFLIPLFINMFLRYDIKAIQYIAIAMLIWNFSFAIFPNNYFDYQNNKELISFIKNNPDKIFILKERNTVVNQYFYEVGTDEYIRLIDYQNKRAIKRVLKEGKPIYTDVLSKKVPFNRADMYDSYDVNFVLIRHLIRIDTELGGFFVDEVSLQVE